MSLNTEEQNFWSDFGFVADSDYSYVTYHKIAPQPELTFDAHKIVGANHTTSVRIGNKLIILIEKDSDGVVLDFGSNTGFEEGIGD
jgi:hypothetical protein